MELVLEHEEDEFLMFQALWYSMFRRRNEGLKADKRLKITYFQNFVYIILRYIDRTNID